MTCLNCAEFARSPRSPLMIQHMEQGSQTHSDGNGQAGLAGRRVLVTGGTTGIGRRTVEVLAGHGANVFTYARDEAQLRDLIESCQNMESGGQVRGVVADQAELDDLKHVFDMVDDQLGGLDILVNNAAIAAESVSDMSLEDIEYAIKTNFAGYLFCTKLAQDRLKNSEEPQIVFIGSMSAGVREEGADVYVATKAGIHGFCESLRKSLSKEDIKITLIEPGSVATEMQAEQKPHEEKILSGEMLSPDDIAQIVVFALSQPRRSEIVEVKVRPRAQAI